MTCGFATSGQLKSFQPPTSIKGHTWWSRPAALFSAGVTHKLKNTALFFNLISKKSIPLRSLVGTLTTSDEIGEARCGINIITRYQTGGNLFPEQPAVSRPSLWSAGAKSLGTLQRRSFQKQTRAETPWTVFLSSSGSNIPAHLLQSDVSFTCSVSAMQIVHQPLDSFAAAREPSLCRRFLQRRILERWSNRWSPSSALSKQHYIIINYCRRKWSSGTHRRQTDRMSLSDERDVPRKNCFHWNKRFYKERGTSPSFQHPQTSRRSCCLVWECSSLECLPSTAACRGHRPRRKTVANISVGANKQQTKVTYMPIQRGRSLATILQPGSTSVFTFRLIHPPLFSALLLHLLAQTEKTSSFRLVSRTHCPCVGVATQGNHADTIIL